MNQNMEGRILDHNPQKQKGLILGNNGNRYEFNTSEFRSQSPIRIDQTVDFKTDGENAFDIYLIKGKNFPTTSETISSFANEENISKLNQKVQEVGGKISESIQGQNYNPLGVSACIVAIITVFFPVVKQISNSKTHVLENGIGLISLFLLLGLMYLFYTGARRVQTKFLSCITSGLLLSGIYDLYQRAYDLLKQNQTTSLYVYPNEGWGWPWYNEPYRPIHPTYTLPSTGFLDVANYGLFAIILALITLLFLAFMGSYKEKN